MATISRNLYVKILNATSAGAGGDIFTNMYLSGFSFGLQKAGDTIKKVSIEFGNINKYKNYGELLVAINNSLRIQGIAGLITVSLGNGFTVLDTVNNVRVTGKEIIFYSSKAAFSLTDSNNHAINEWLYVSGAPASRPGYKTMALGTPTTMTTPGVSSGTKPPTSSESRYSKADKHIILPFIYVSRASDTDEQVSETPRTAVIESADNSQRTAINVSKLLNYNPEGTLDMSGNIPRDYERYIQNCLLGVSQRVLGQPDVEVFVTNPMKWVDIVDFLPGRLRFKKEQLEAYLEDTEQTGDRFKIAVVIETIETVHTAYLELEVISDPEYATTTDRKGNTVPYPYSLARVLLGTMPVTTPEIIYSVKAFYPILTVYSSINMQFKETKDGPEYTFSCMINPSENKRSVL